MQQSSVFFYVDSATTRLRSRFESLIQATSQHFSKTYIVWNGSGDGDDAGSDGQLQRQLRYRLPNVCKQITNNESDLNGRYDNFKIYEIRRVSPLLSHYNVGVWCSAADNDGDVDGRASTVRRVLRKNVHVHYVVLQQHVRATEFLATVLAKKNDFFREGVRPETCIVYDLDETLIDDQYTLLSPNVIQLLRNSKTLFDRLVLWTHGNTNHARASLQLHHEFEFDLVISRNVTAQRCYNKGIGLVLRNLNQVYGVTNLLMSVLVDDTRRNYNNDYDYFIQIPRTMPDPGQCFERIINCLAVIKNSHLRKQIDVDYSAQHNELA